MYLVRNKRTKDFIDNTGDWTMIRSFAKKFASKDEAQKFINKHQTKNDEPYMEIISENVQKHLKEYLAEAKEVKSERFDKNQIKKLIDFIEDYCTEVFSDAAMKYAQKYANSPDEIEEYLDYFDDKVYIKFDDLAKAINKKLHLNIDKKDKTEIKQIMNKADCGTVELKEATMSDIPHEIDDQIHKLKDMRFDLEETQKNWNLAGMDTNPLSEIISEINNLIEVMYSKGANLANQTIKESDKMKSFKQYLRESKLTESVSNIPSDLRNLVNKHCGMSKFTKDIYDASHKDLNELEMSSNDIKSGKKISTADIDKIANDGMYLVVDLGNEGMLLAGKGMFNVVYDGKKRHDDVYVNGRNYDIDSTRNIASVLNTDQFKDAKYWLIDLSKAKSTEDLRKERQEAQKGIIQRYNDRWYGPLDKSGYKVDRHKYEEMLQKLKIAGNDYVNQLSEISARLFKAMANPKAKEHSYDIGKAIDAIQTATRESVSSYNDASYVKGKIKKADDAVKIVEKYAE